jgi:hypothetical protein
MGQFSVEKPVAPGSVLSGNQHYAHAFSVLTNGEDWLPEARVYWAFDPSQNRYLMMMYNVTWPLAATE